MRDRPENSIDFLFVHVPKYSNYYRPADDFMFINFIPMGVFALCDLLNKNGIVSRIKHCGLETIIDPAFSIVRWIKIHGVKCVGLSLHWHYQSYDVIDVAQKIKEQCPEILIVLGGFTASYFASEILENFSCVDAVISGDAEAGIVEFARIGCAEGGRDFSAVCNCTWRSPYGIRDNGLTYCITENAINLLDFANLGLLYNVEKYRDYFRLPMFWMNNASLQDNLKRRIGAQRLFPLALGRGCKVNCTYCGGGAAAQKRIFNRNGPVFRLAGSVVDSMEKALSYGYNGFIASFDPSPDDDRYILGLMSEVRSRGLRCAFGYESWGLPTRQVIDAFIQTFLHEGSYIALSVECGSDVIRQKNKGLFFDNQQLLGIMEYLQIRRLPTLIYFTAGLPGESREQLQETATFARYLQKRFSKILVGIFCLPVQMEPASPMFEMPSSFGVHSLRSRFIDFYESHKSTNSGPFTCLAYGTDALEKDPEKLAALILRERCKNYCFITPKIFGKIPIPWLGRFICKRIRSGYLRKGKGLPEAVRRTFC